MSKNIVYTQTHDADPETMSASLERLEKENLMISGALTRLQEESALLRELFNNANSELNNLKRPSLLVAEVISVIEPDRAIVKLPNGNKFYSYVAKKVEDLRSGDSALVEQKSLNIVEKINVSHVYDVEKYVIVEKPTEDWSNIGGLQNVINEIIEVIELPLKSPELFEKVGIHPPKGVLLHGPPGTGKTLLAKAVAHSTNATFIEVVGSELVQKFIGEGAKLVKDIFTYARKHAPAIVFIDELDAVAAQRMDTGTSGEREVNRTFMQLLAELDGFKPLGDVKVIAATNRLDILDTAIIRPGRLDRIIEVTLPSPDDRLQILEVHTQRMSLKRVKLANIVEITEEFSGADLKAVCTEAGFFAIREGRDHVKQQDFEQAVEKIRLDYEEDQEAIFG